MLRAVSGIEKEPDSVLASLFEPVSVILKRLFHLVSVGVEQLMNFKANTLQRNRDQLGIIGWIGKRPARGFVCAIADDQGDAFLRKGAQLKRYGDQ